MIRRTFCNSSLVIIGCFKAFLLLLRRERGTIRPSGSTHAATCLNWTSVCRQPASTCIGIQVRLTIALHPSSTRLIASLLMRFKRLIFLRRVSLIYQCHLLILLEILCPNFWKMLLLNFVFLLMLSHNNLIQILWTPNRHCLNSLPCSICTLSIKGGLVQHHFAIAVLVGHIWRVTNELAWVRWPMHVLVDAYWIVARVIFLSKLLSDSTIF